MADKIVHPSTGFVEFFRTPEEKELVDYQERVGNLENELEELKELVKSSNEGDKNATKD